MLTHPIATRLLRLLPAFALPGACLLALPEIPQLAASWQQLLIEVLPTALLACAMLLSIRFNRSRMSFLLLLVAIGWASQTHFRGQLLPATESLLFAVLMANAFAFSLLKDRGLLSIHGLVRCSVLALQGAAIYFLATQLPAIPAALLEPEWFDLPDSVAIFVQLPDAVLLAGLLICLVHMGLSLAGNDSVQATFFGCQLGLLGIASGYPHDAFVPVMVASCGLLVLLYVILDSHDMAYRDELTALPSRRALNQSLLSLGRRYSIAMLDIDHFKQFNDKHGHDVGDEVLRMVATRIRRVGGGGKAYRYGGEEFTIVFPGKTPEQAEPHLEALRESIEQYPMQVRGRERKPGKSGGLIRGRKPARNQTLGVTVSIGYAAREEGDKHPEAVIKSADKALYRAKQKGRNRLSR